MKGATSGQHPRPRTLIHPGRVNPIRINSLSAKRGRHVRLALQPGRSIFDGIVEPLAEMGVVNASMTVLGGFCETFQYCVAPRDPSGKAVIAYGPPIDAGPSYLIFGNATLGISMKGKPLVHCHAAVRREDGRVKGGHVLTESCIVGPSPIPVLVLSLDEFDLRQAVDPETNLPLLQPVGDHANE